jgi:hypothetical protein
MPGIGYPAQLMRPFQAFSAIVVLAGLLLAAAAWSAPRIDPLVPPSTVRAGCEYETLVPALPAGVEEFELFLLPEDGSGRAIRLTPEREAADGPLRWRMPRIEAARARLVLRAGGRFGETESEPSALFAIEPAGSRELAEILRGEDELTWHFGEGDGAGDARLLPPGATTLGNLARALVAVAPTRGAGIAPPASVARVTGGAIASFHPAPPAPAGSRRPSYVPQRN